jgi:predicted Zn-dependent peptidase
MSNPDYHSLKIANQILGGGAESKLFMNLREKHGFTYGSYSNVGSGRYQSNFSTSAQVRSDKADSAVAEMLIEIENMRKGNLTAEELEGAKAKYNGSFAIGMEDPAKTANYASNILINNLPKDFYRTFLQKINAITISDIQKVSTKYFEKNKSRIIRKVLGDFICREFKFYFRI